MSQDALNTPQEKPLSSSSQTDDEPISLVEETAESKIRPQARKTFGASAAERVERKTDFKRPMNMTGQGATRCRMFHSKIALASLENMETQINTWVDDEEIEVKHVGHVIGIMEGKRSEPNMLVMVWY